jgi:hypothetical protein
MFSECNIIKISSIAPSLFTFNMKKHPTQNKLVKECEDSWVRESLTSPCVAIFFNCGEDYNMERGSDTYWTIFFGILPLLL